MLGSLLVGGVFWAKLGFGADTDFWWHLRVGEDILATHHFPVADPYSFTAAGHPWLAAEWLGDVLFASAERLGGLRAVSILLIVMSAAVILAVYTLATVRSGNPKAAFVATVLLTPIALPVLNFRPQMLGFLFLASTLILLERFKKERTAGLWLLPLLILIWENVHGSWVLGLFSLAVYYLGGLTEYRLGNMVMRAWTPRERVRLLLIFMLCLAVLPITPYGSQLAPYPIVVALSSFPVNLASINEWQPMPFNLFGAKLFLGLVFSLFIAQVLVKPKWRMEELALFFFGTMMACLHVRFILIFVPFAAPLVATLLSLWMPGYEREKDKYLLNAALMTAVLVAMIHNLPTKTETEQSIAAVYPAGAAEYIRKHQITSRMLNSYGFGGYLEWAGGVKVFIDGRGEFYEIAGVFADYMHISTLKPGALTVLHNYQVDTCLLDRDKPLAVLLEALPEWQSVYADKVSVLFLRRDSIDVMQKKSALGLEKH